MTSKASIRHLPFPCKLTFNSFFSVISKKMANNLTTNHFVTRHNVSINDVKDIDF